jgi:hypothetical protein
MLKINIIPTYLKNEIKLRAIYFIIKNSFYIFIIFIITYTIVLLVGKLVLQINFVKTINETTLLTKNTERNNKNFSGINKEINSIEKIQSGSIKWTELFEFMGKNIPNGIKFSRILVDGQKNTINLSGNSINRANLIEFKNFLENSGIFSEINFPIKNFLEKFNINFEVSAKIKSYDFE